MSRTKVASSAEEAFSRFFRFSRLQRREKRRQRDNDLGKRGRTERGRAIEQQALIVSAFFQAEDFNAHQFGIHSSFRSAKDWPSLATASADWPVLIHGCGARHAGGGSKPWRVNGSWMTGNTSDQPHGR